MLKNAKDTVLCSIIHTMYKEPDNTLDSLTIGKVANELVNRTSTLISTFTNYEQCKEFGKHLASDRIRVSITINSPDAPPSKYGVYVEGRSRPKYEHKTFESADTEALRLVDHTKKRVAVVVRMYEPVFTHCTKRTF